MKALITAKPMFHLTLDVQTVAVLMKLSKAHYDRICAAVSSQGGFLYGWNNAVNMGADCSADFRQLDLTLKIAEMAGIALSFDDGGEAAAIRRYCKFVRNLLKESEQFAKYAIKVKDTP